MNHTEYQQNINHQTKMMQERAMRRIYTGDMCEFRREIKILESFNVVYDTHCYLYCPINILSQLLIFSLHHNRPRMTYYMWTVFKHDREMSDGFHRRAIMSHIMKGAELEYSSNIIMLETRHHIPQVLANIVAGYAV